jgi:excisionase family DNA binding protein
MTFIKGFARAIFARYDGEVMDYMTLTEMAAALGLKGTASIRRLILDGKIRAEKMGKTWLVPLSEVERYRVDHLGKRGFPKGKSRKAKTTTTTTTTTSTPTTTDAPRAPQKTDDIAQ